MGFLFDEHDAYRILQESEGRADFNGKNVGHARARHVAISKAALHDRMILGGTTKDGMPIYTAFTSVRDQARAVAAAINAPASAELMNRFFHPDRIRPGVPQQLCGVQVSAATSVRVAVGGDGPPMRGSAYVTVYFSKFPSRHRNMHIVTAFAALTPGELADV